MDPSTPKPVVHLELHTADLEAGCGFYESLCGWRRQPIDTGAGSYLALEMGNGMGGGAVECGTPRSLWLPYVEVRDVALVTERARALGARVALAPREGPVGRRSVIATAYGAEIALWQPKR